MDRQLLLIILALCASQTALILSAGCLSTHYWIEAKPTPFNATEIVSKNTTISVLTYSKGLWRLCVENETTYYITPNVTRNDTTVFDTQVNGTEECYVIGKPSNYTGVTPQKNDTNTALFKITQFTYTFGYGLITIGTLLLYMLLFVQKARLSVCVATSITVSLFTAGALYMVSLVIEGQHYPSDTDFQYLGDHYQLSLGWSFHMGVAGDVLTYIGAIASVYNLVMAKSTLVPDSYKNLNVDS